MERFDTIRVDLMSWVLARCLVDLASEKGFSGVEDAFDVEEFCLLICSRKVLFIPLRSIACGCRTVGPLFNCCLKLRYLSCN